ncbi:hypothetical protein F53441_8033 [Fusarium austroafricanum]|uniref:Apple domain-containing protein n=1 Tax=Fusarium austroafricanum TaxID=2364996 RepID=A0A8H4KEV9_9HYPO|nr:hypothetical protein F53441_8033 [Fusarium austroafricanum]
MIAQNVLVALAGLAVGVQASPCKPSSVTTTTGTASTDVTSITGTTTSEEPTTTTEASTTTTNPVESVCLKSPAPAGKSCNAQGGGQGDLQTMGNANALSLASCHKACQDRAGCVAFALQPGSWCALWAGTFTGTSGGESSWSWYDMDCFCDESSTTTSGPATETTTTQATTIELTASSSEATETTAATTTTADAQPTYSCPGGFPADSSCDIKFNHVGGSVGRIVGELGAEAAASVDDCVRACAANKDCDFFAFWPNQFCELWNGNYQRSDSVVPWSWYELSCFCVPGRETTPTAATTTEATTTEATTTPAATYACANGEKSPFPANKVCNKHGVYAGTAMDLLDVPSGVKMMESCRKACRDNSDCTYFAFTPGQSCWIYSGTIESVTDSQTDYIWYDMDCFCDLDEPTVTTTTEATTTEAAETSVVPPP